MAEVTAALVKELREKSGAGMMDCKKALTESAGDIEAAVDWLRKKGLAAASKKAGRVAAEGLVAVAGEGTTAVVVEVNSETDFVARNADFQKFVASIADAALAVKGDHEALLAATPGGGKSMADQVTDMIATIGENLNLRRSAGLSVSDGVVASYVHAAVAPGLGRIGVLVALESTGDKAKLAVLGRQVAMHIAAAAPLAVDVSDLDSQTVERERAVFAEQARESGKPENIIEKMVEGRLRKFYEESVLLKQTFVIDGENTVEAVLKSAEADIGAPVGIAGFIAYRLGEGIEREESDFAAEVAAAAGH